MPVFNSSRLKLARKRRRMTSTELARISDISAVTISRIERTDNEPTDETIKALATALSFPIEFFFGPDVEEVEKDAASFRSLKSMSAKERDAALAAASVAFLVSDWVEVRFNLPSADLFDFGHERDPQIAARRLRSRWGLGEQPISNMIELLEAKGVRVFSLSENTRSVDAFSCWRGAIPYIFLNTFKSSEHSRFDAAHELGHLCLHRHGGPQQKNAEAEANMFAASFLMPEADVRSRILYINSLDQIRIAKKRWGVSLSALTYRLSKLGILSEWQSRRFFIEINRLGFRTTEPDPIPHEFSFIWQTVFRELWKDRITKHDIAEALHIPAEELESVVFGLASPAFDPRARLDAESNGRPVLAIDNK
ncbi:MAG: XRE family transcriptional regulator [Parvibaculum sp.]|uniref:helix-turn-helix domain-containing protein n=1 Tax=Parvibaculum sp. TaxID=2024848 RepID=UPI0027175372|nr:XRE family transcriptional regulator [Parvibaculum sp.]MDO8838259.1 XRE family transcriptional regulator [Parvibaculum sp.]